MSERWAEIQGMGMCSLKKLTLFKLIPRLISYRTRSIIKMKQWTCLVLVLLDHCSFVLHFGPIIGLVRSL